MKILQINAVYSKSSTGRTTREMHEFLLAHGFESYVAAPDLADLKSNCFKIGNKIDHKIHALKYRITGKQAYSSVWATKQLLKWMDSVSPDVVILRNLHGNYINLPLLVKYLAEHDTPTTLVLHDSWFITGGCTYYIAPHCYKWKTTCGTCPAIHKDIKSWFFDQTHEILQDRQKLFAQIRRLSIIGVSQWVTNDAKESVLKHAFRIQCIYNWIDLAIFRPQNKKNLKEKYGFDKDKFIVLGVSATWSKAKGIDLFNRLSKILPSKYNIILIGNSDTLQYKASTITYLPPTNNVMQLADMYAMADVYVNPTIQETFGKTTAEALSCGTPVVAYKGTATPELIGQDEKCGYLINELDADLFAEKIKDVCNSDVETYSSNCRNRSVSMFNIETNINKYISLFNEMIS